MINTNRMLVGLAVAAVVGVATRTLAAAPRPNVVELTVTQKGFEPARVEVKQGQPLKLIVTRITDKTCAGTAATGQRGMVGNQGRMMGGGMMGGQNGMMGGGMQDMRTIHGLLSQHDKIKRSVKDIPNGVESVTTSDDPQVATMIREHTWQMKSRIEEGRPIHQMDPLFREIFANHQHIHMQIADIPGGVRVTETADTANVVPLVRQHARRAVSEFVAQGMPRMMQPTPLPEGYKPSEASNGSANARHGCGCMNRT